MFVRTYTSENADTFSSISGDHIVCRVSVRNEMRSTCLFSIFRKLPPPRPQGVLSYSNRPFPSYKNPHFQNEGKCKIEFCLHKNIEYFSYKKLRTSPQWGRDRRALPRIFRLFWISPPKIPSQLEPPKIIPESKISNPSKTFDYLRHLNSDFPSPPLSTPLGLSLALPQSIGATW